MVLANFLKTQMNLAIEALDRYPKEERDISALTLTLSPEAFKAAQEEIRALQRKLLALTDLYPKPDTVYQANFQLFPLSR